MDKLENHIEIPWDDFGLTNRTIMRELTHTGSWDLNLFSLLNVQHDKQKRKVSVLIDKDLAERPWI